MLRSLLVPLDGSKLSERSLPMAEQIAQEAGATVHLAHVHVPYEPDQLLGNTQFQYEGVNVEEYDTLHRENEAKRLSDLASRLKEGGASAEAKVLEGKDVAEQLSAYADQVEAELILMTTHGFTGLNRMWIGSVADAMIRQTSRPLLMLHPQEHVAPEEGPPRIRHVFIPLDGSDLSEGVLAPGSDLALVMGARITLAHMVRVPQFGSPPVMPSLGEGGRLPLDSALTYLEEIAEGLRAEGLDVQTHAWHGSSPAGELAAVADELEADVIALATHGYGGLKRSVLGSVADKLLRSSSLPVLVVRPPSPS